MVVRKHNIFSASFEEWHRRKLYHIARSQNEDCWRADRDDGGEHLHKCSR